VGANLDEQQLDLVFPAYIRISPDLKIISVGRSLRRLAPQAQPGTGLLDSFRIKRPTGPVDFQGWVRAGSALQLQATTGSMVLRGLVLAEEAGFLLCVSHAISSIADLEASGLTMADFSQADSSLTAILAAGFQASMLSETRELMTALAGARDDALAASKAKSAFLANMSHEIRTPLNGILGIIGTLARTPLTPSQQEMVQLIMGSGQSLERLLSDILDLSKVEAGEFGIESAPFCLGASVRDAVRLMQIRADDKGLVFGLDLAPDAETWVMGDTVRLKQVVSNLVSNAIKFTDRGRVDVVLGVTALESGRVGIRIDVRDTGIGLDAEARERVFQRFAQADGSITRRFGGTGLGLAISRDLAEAMGGEITLESEPGSGSCFTLLLNLPRAEASPQSVSPLDGPSSDVDEIAAFDSPLRVLLVEDNVTNQRVVQLILETLGAEIAVANNGQEALDLYHADGFDVILMDMQMPVMDGLTATRLIRAREGAAGWRRTPVAMLTANTLDEHRQTASNAGADYHIPKPITPESLIRGIEAALAAAGRFI
jgi:signal transduction histidine kinase/ActR/RegA family two-component response regulator